MTLRQTDETDSYGLQRAIVAAMACAYTHRVNKSWLRSSRPRRALFATAAAIALIAAQAIVLGHDIASESHAPDSFCEFCIAGASLSGANVDAVKPVARPTVSVRLPDTSVDRARPDGFRNSRLARAPPTAS